MQKLLIKFFLIVGTSIILPAHPKFKISKHVGGSRLRLVQHYYSIVLL